MQTTRSVRCNLNKPTLLWLLGKVQISGTLLSALSLSRVQTGKLCYSQVGGGETSKEIFCSASPTSPQTNEGERARADGNQTTSTSSNEKKLFMTRDQRREKVNLGIFKA